jgi:hypothetical protein
MNKDQVKAIALKNGFELKEQSDGARDLHPYVYEFAQALLETAPEAEPFVVVDAIRYRVAYFSSAVKPFTVTADDERQEMMCQQDARFIGWLTDWQEIKQ